MAVELIMSRLWDLGTTGLYRSPEGEIVAGFKSQDEARSAARHLEYGPSATPTAVAASIVIEPAPEADHRADRESVIVEVADSGHRFDLAINANGAFGHGGHATTRLALDLLLDTPLQGRRVLDVGTGTGILAIAAAKAGAGSVTAIDNDPTAVAVASGNAARNGVTIACGTASISELLTAWPEEEPGADPGFDGRPVNGLRFDVIVCNVLLSTHRELWAQIRAAVAPGGVVITAGYLEEQADELVTLYAGGRSAPTPPVGSIGSIGPLETLVIERSTNNGDWSAHRFRAPDRVTG